VGLLSWEYPSCVVPLEGGTAAIACGYPTDDDEALGGWASRIAIRLSKDRVRRVVLSGSELAKAQIAWELGKRYVQDQELAWGCAVEHDPAGPGTHRAAGPTLPTRRKRRGAR